MIAYLCGSLAEKHPTRVIVDVGGVGYEVLIPISTYERLPATGAEVKLLIYDLIREGDRQLFGFARESEREMFGWLLGITGIGPKIALSALSGLTSREIKRAVAEEDSKRLSSISGVGKKMAERMAIELKHKLSATDLLEAGAGMGDDSDSGDTRIRDVALALIALGYKQLDAEKLARTASSKAGAKESVEDLVRSALVS
jgi:Holliday junction DNA helicase RuvA